MVRKLGHRREHKSELGREHRLVWVVCNDAKRVSANADVSGSMVPEHKWVREPGSKLGLELHNRLQQQEQHNGWLWLYKTNHLLKLPVRRQQRHIR